MILKDYIKISILYVSNQAYNTKKMIKTTNAIITSIWDDDIETHAKCTIDPDTKEITNIKRKISARTQGVVIKEIIIINGKEHQLITNNQTGRKYYE